MSQSIEVVSVNVSHETGTVKHAVPEIVVDGLGIQGDAHAGPWQRQVSLLNMESIERFAREIGREIRAGEFGENLTVRGVDAGCVALLDRLHFGTAELEITQIGKRCHGERCSIFQQVGKCVMPVEGVFARVLNGGIIRPGDWGEHVARSFRFLVVTVSDRAAAGEYADRSGPKIKELIETFAAGKPRPVQIETVIVPDEPEQLRGHLLAAKQRGIDVVFTTGGTGIGPRDTTPETVAAVCDRIIPGIMEYVRVTCGAKNPNSLLSRSIAGVAGRTLIYALPGSVRAIAEYMEEILKTVEHAIFVLSGLDVH